MSFTLDVVREVLGVEPGEGVADELTPRELQRLCDALIPVFMAWEAPTCAASEYRMCISVGPFEQGPPVPLGTAALLAHTVVLRDPLEEWINRWIDPSPALGDPLDVSDYALDDLSEVLRIHRSLEPLVDAGIVHFAPLPVDLTRWGTGDRWEQLPIGIHELITDPDVAECALGRLPVPREQWVDAVEREDWAHKEFDPVEEVEVALHPHLVRAMHAMHAEARVIPVTELERRVWASGLYGPMVRALTRKEQRTFEVATRIQLPLFDDLKPADIVAIRSDSEGFEAWRDWLGDVCTQALLLADDDTHALRDEVSERLAAAMSEVKRDIAPGRRLRDYRRRDLQTDLLALGIGGSAAAATGSAWPLIGPAAKTAYSVVRRTLFRPAPRGWQGVLWSLSKRR